MGCPRDSEIEVVRSLQEEGRLEESIEPLRSLLVTRPEDPEVHYRYGLALRRTGQPALAVWSLRKAREDREWAVRAGIELTQAALAAQTWESAIEAASDVLEIEPENVRVLAMRAEAHMGRLSEPERALEDIDRGLDLAPHQTGLLAARVRALLMLGEIDAAVDAMAELEDPSAESHSQSEYVRGQICVARAILDAERGARDQAEIRIRECIEAFPSHHAVVTAAVNFFDEAGRPWDGNRVLRDALVEVPSVLNYRTWLATRLRNANRVDDAERLLRDGIRPSDPVWLVTGALAALTEHYVAIQDLDSAVETYSSAIALVEEPGPGPLLTQADLLTRVGRNREALAVAAQLENDAHRGLIEARVHLNEFRPARALERLDEVLPGWPDNPGARYYAARAAEQIGDLDRAVEEYRQSIRSSATATDAGLRLARLHAARGVYADAWVAISHHFKAHPTDSTGAEFMVRIARPSGALRQLAALMPSLARSPVRATVVAVQAELIAASQGPGRAIEWLEQGHELDWTLVRNAPILRVFVTQLATAGQAQRALGLARRVRATHEEIAAFHEVEGRVLERVPGRSREAEEAFRRALAIDERDVLALEGLARLAEADGDALAAIGFYDRVAALAPERVESMRRGAMLAARSLPPGEGTRRWEALLREHPWDGEAALRLATQRFAVDPQAEETLELALRAQRFREGPETQALLDRVRAARAGSRTGPRDLESQGRVVDAGV